MNQPRTPLRQRHLARCGVILFSRGWQLAIAIDNPPQPADQHASSGFQPRSAKHRGNGLLNGGARVGMAVVSSTRAPWRRAPSRQRKSIAGAALANKRRKRPSPSAHAARASLPQPAPALYNVAPQFSGMALCSPSSTPASALSSRSAQSGHQRWQGSGPRRAVALGQRNRRPDPPGQAGGAGVVRAIAEGLQRLGWATRPRRCTNCKPPPPSARWGWCRRMKPRFAPKA